MSRLTAPQRATTIDPLLHQAKTAVQQNNRQLAQQLLQQAVRQDPQDYRGWLWLATVAQSPQASLDYINRAEMLAPNNETVQKARRWAEKRLSQSQMAEPEPTQSIFNRRWFWAAGAIILLLLLVGGTAVAWQYFQAGSDVAETAVRSNSLLPDGQQQSEENAPVAATAVSIQPTVTQTPHPYVPAKQIASTGSDQPRATWTVTPTPSPTPTPTPTVIPTFVNPNYQDAARPFGVGPTERWVDVDLSAQTLRAYEGDTVVYTTLVSSGTWDHPTVTGQFRIWLTFESQTMDGRLLGYDYYLEDVPYVMYFYQDYALHGTFWHSNFGTPMSHGCVNLATSDAAWMYSFVSIGTLVNVHY